MKASKYGAFSYSMIADRLLKIIKRKRFKLPGSHFESFLPTRAVMIPENPAKATDISAIDNNTSRLVLIPYYLYSIVLMFFLKKFEEASLPVIYDITSYPILFRTLPDRGLSIKAT